MSNAEADYINTVSVQHLITFYKTPKKLISMKNKHFSVRFINMNRSMKALTTRLGDIKSYST